MPGYGPIVETIHFTDPAVWTGDLKGWYGTHVVEGLPYPAGWDAGAAQTARDGAPGAAAYDPGSVGLQYSYTRGPYATVGIIPDRFRYRGVHSETVRGAYAWNPTFPPHDPELPPGATGWDWDTDTFELESAVMDVEFDGRLVDIGDTARATDDLSLLRVKIATGVTWDTTFPNVVDAWDGSEGAVLAETSVSRADADPNPTFSVDVFPYVETVEFEEAMGRIATALTVDLDTPDPMPTGLGTTSGGGFTLSGGMIMGITYGYQIGYRFWYEGDPPTETLSVVRNWPRRDGLGFAPAARNYPPSLPRGFGDAP